MKPDISSNEITRQERNGGSGRVMREEKEEEESQQYLLTPSKAFVKCVIYLLSSVFFIRRQSRAHV
jgi:hypothetical protein